MSEVLDGHGLVRSKWVAPGNEQDPVLFEQQRADGQVRFFYGPLGDLHINLATSYGTVQISQLYLVDPDLTARMLTLQVVPRLEEHVGGHRTGVPDVEYAADSPSGRHRPRDRLMSLPVRRQEIVTKLLAHHRQPDPAARPLEQRNADTALQLLDCLAYAALGQPEPLRRAPEVQFLGQSQEHLDLMPFQSLFPPGGSCRPEILKGLTKERLWPVGGGNGE